MNKRWLIGIIVFISLIILGFISLYIVKFVFFASLDGDDQTEKTYPEANLDYPVVKVRDIAEPGNYNLKAFVMYVDYCLPCPPNTFCKVCSSINGIIISDDDLTGKIDKENFKNGLFNTNETIIFSDISNPKQFKSKHKYLFSVSILEITQLHYFNFIKEENKSKLIVVNDKKEGIILGYSEME